MFRQLMAGKKKFGSSWLPHRRSRHRSAQMKFWSGPRGKKKLESNNWTFANKQAKKYRGNGLFGIN